MPHGGGSNRQLGRASESSEMLVTRDAHWRDLSCLLILLDLFAYSTTSLIAQDGDEYARADAGQLARLAFELN